MLDEGMDIIARAVMVKDGNVLLCKLKDETWHYLPGGHIEPGETVEDGLLREFREETGLDLGSLTFIGAVEQLFFQKRGQAKVHELNLVFSAEPPAAAVRSIEGHIEFSWQDIAGLAAVEMLPEQFQTLLPQWTKDKRPFWYGLKKI